MSLLCLSAYIFVIYCLTGRNKSDFFCADMGRTAGTAMENENYFDKLLHCLH
jgi:hypothetical protein